MNDEPPNRQNRRDDITCATPDDSRAPAPAPRPRKRAVIALIESDSQWLVIRRSETVAAPGKLCFPGGTIEPGESQRQALVRELREELRIETAPVACIWTSHSSWGTELNWWTVRVDSDLSPKPDLQEVAWWGWMWPEELERHPDTLVSNLEFIRAWRAGRFSLLSSSPSDSWLDTGRPDNPPDVRP